MVFEYHNSEKTKRNFKEEAFEPLIKQYLEKSSSKIAIKEKYIPNFGFFYVDINERYFHEFNKG